MEGQNKTKAKTILDDVSKMSSRLSEVGRQIVFAIIAGAWTLSYSYGSFCPSKFIVWSIGFAFLYLFCDLLYYLTMMWTHKNYLDFKTDVGKLELKEKQLDIFKKQTKWKKISFNWSIFKTLLLLASAALIIIHILVSLQ